MIKQTFSGFVVRKSKRLNPNVRIREWIGCGTEDELHDVYMSMQDDAVHDNRAYPGDLEIEPATDEEIKRFKGEVGPDWIPPHLK